MITAEFLSSSQYQSTYQVWWRCIDTKLSPWNENMDIRCIKTAQKLAKFAHKQSQTRYTKCQGTHQVWWKSLKILLVIIRIRKYGRVAGRYLLKNWSLPISNPEPDLNCIYIHIRFGESPMTFIQFNSHPETKIRIDSWQTHGHSMWNHYTLPPSCGGV